MPIDPIEQFDGWIRHRFKDLNTQLEERYFGQDDPADVMRPEHVEQQMLHDEGLGHIQAILTAATLPSDEAAAYDLLGNVGLYMAALRRHELSNPDREQRSPFAQASALAMQLAAGLGVAPRFATPHVNLRNLAHGGTHKSFTWLHDESVFIVNNCFCILGYIRAADVLRRVLPLGVTHPVTPKLLADATAALDEVSHYTEVLNQTLDVRRFFYNVRPYFKTYKVGRTDYRGANAGDFSAINEIDPILGLCRITDAAYSAQMLEKMPFMTSEDQRGLQSCARQTSLMDRWLEALPRGPLDESSRLALQSFLAVCEAHGRAAVLHHHVLVTRFIEEPATQVDIRHLKQITASGPPLEVLLHSLKSLTDKRAGVQRDDIETRYHDLQCLRRACQAT